jgi:hypothetical protein
MNSNKTVSANSKGIVISYGDVNKHMFTQYESRYSFINKIQVEGTSKYQRLETKHFTLLQQEMYNKIVYGFSAYTKEEVQKMSKTSKFNITVTYTKAHRILNRWKQEIINEKMDSLLSKLFPNSPIVKQMVGVKGYDDNLTVSTTFKDLGITRDAIAKKLMEYGFLPNNFYQLS